MPSSPPSDTGLDERLRLILTSYRRLTGSPLIDEAPEDIVALRAAVWNAPRAIVAHGTETDPVFFYGNRLALRMFGMRFAEFTHLPSRLSAEPLAQAARIELLEEVSRRGFIAGYSGVRIAKDGRRFIITDCTVWNLADAAGVHHGQAAVFCAADEPSSLRP
ncbi:MAG: MEKHLA domain-containing protein [Gallionella sp.]|nr:MEKHLA domain-containing protein [Gallionella sp.]